MNIKRKVVLYIRVSTAGQAIEDVGYSIPEQLERLMAYCKSRDWEIVEIYTDGGFSGATLERPAMEKLIADIPSGAFDTVLVYKLDRLSRSQKDTLFLIEDQFLPNNIDFVSVQETLDTATPFGRAMIGILSVFSQLERETIRERTFGGRVGRAKRGLWHGGGPHPIGYDYIEGELVINHHEAEQVRRVYQLYSEGYSLEHISHAMEGYETKHGNWQHSSTIGNVLDNPLYSGTIHFEEVESPESHDKIITDELDHEVKKRRKKYKSARFQQKDSDHLLTGFIFCEHCGARYSTKKQHSGNIYYCCHSRMKVNKKMIKDPSCKNDNRLKEDIEKKVIDELKMLSESPNLLEKALEEQKKAAEESGGIDDKAQREIADIDKEIQRLMSLYGKGKVPEEAISDSINSLYARKKELKYEENSQISFVATSYSFGRLKRLLREFVEFLEVGSTKKLRLLLSEIVDRISIDGENVNIHLSL